MNMTTGPGTAGRDGGLNLQFAVAKLLPSPRASDGEKAGPNMRGSSGDEMLPSVVHRVITDCGIDWQEYGPAIERWGRITGVPAPFPAAYGPRGGVKPAPEFVEWMMGLPVGHVSSVSGLTINQKLKLLGNGVAPPQAEYAIHALTQGDEKYMTNTDTSSFFTTHQRRDVPRNQWGQYLLPDPVTGDTEGWVRATTFAATLAEQYGLSIWHQRQVVWGLSRRPDLLTLASTISGPEDKKALGEIVKEAHIAAGTDAKANRGTAIHKAIQASESGAHELVPEELRPHVTKYFEVMKREGIKIIPEYVERTVIVRQYHVAGTFDNLVLCPDGKIRVSDKKTGRMDYSDVEFAVQMAIYANADAMFNYDTGQYEPMPEIAKDYAILMHIDPVTGHTEPLRINIQWGWTFARTCAEVMDIRKVKNIITPYVSETHSWGTQIDGVPISVPTAQSTPPSVLPNGVSETPLRHVTRAIGQIAADAGVGSAALDSVRPQTLPNGVPVHVSSAVPSGQFAVVDGPVIMGASTPNYQHGDRDIRGTVPGGFVDSSSPVPEEFQAFWSDDRHDNESAWDVTDIDSPHAAPPDLVAAAIEAQQPEATPQSVMAAAGAPIAEPPDDQAVAELSDVDGLMRRIVGLKSKAKVQAVARDLMDLVGEPGAIKLNQYQHKIASEIITQAWRAGIPIPGNDKDGKPFGVPAGPGPDPDAWKNNTAPAPKSESPEQPVTDFEAQERAAVESIRSAPSLAHLQTMHDHYVNQTRIGWTDTMQAAARTRSAELDQQSGDTELSPLEMILGATSKATLAKAWSKATDNGQNRGGWTEEMQSAAMAKQSELSGVATSGNQ
jgi:hypothetical protein